MGHEHMHAWLATPRTDLRCLDSALGQMHGGLRAAVYLLHSLVLPTV